MITPKPLFKGARVALLAASGPVPNGRHDKAYESVRALGLEPVIYPSCCLRHGYFAGNDAQRAADLMNAFTDDSIDGILLMRGGYGMHRLLPLLDMAEIAKHPKFISGYSDVTALLIALNQLSDMVAYHTVMPSTEYYKPLDEYSMDYLKRALVGGLEGELLNPEGRPFTALNGGMANGTLKGGNLSLVHQSLGGKWEIDTKGKILFLEDVEEKPYHIDGMLTQLRNAGKLDDCAGFILGYWTKCAAETPENSLSLEQIFDELLVPTGKPIIAGLCCGHDLPSCSLAMGRQVEIDADALSIRLL